MLEDVDMLPADVYDALELWRDSGGDKEKFSDEFYLLMCERAAGLSEKIADVLAVRVGDKNL